MNKPHPSEVIPQEAKRLLKEALSIHPALQHLPSENRPMAYMVPQGVGLDWGTGRKQLRFFIEDARWWHQIETQAPALADRLVDGLRGRIRDERSTRGGWSARQYP